MKLTSTLALAAAGALVATSAAAQTREEIRVVGSSTVFPYSQAAAEEFGNTSEFPAPIVESTGTGGGMQIFCQGIGARHPDLTGASRAMTASEYELCTGNGVTDITEALIGFDGLSMAVSRESEYDWDMSLGEMYLALGAQVPVDGEWVDNPYQQWSDIDDRFLDIDIIGVGPPPTSGTRDAWVELAMHPGCEEPDYVQEGGFDSDWVEANCSRMRTVGRFIEAGENDNLIVQRLQSDPNALGIFGYSFVYENLDTIEGVALNGVEPNFDTIADKSFPVSRPLYFYVKNAHRGVIPGLNAFVEEYASEDALAPGGYLTERGLVPLTDARRAEMQENVISGVNMAAPKG